ncbi:phage terminase small subunit [Streptomyces turgidiscabies]|uniref:phage terminase small subunit n=1 Tax=Streptomyces turgidiscabies TaxID=85558 RepID=UPI0038F81390
MSGPLPNPAKDRSRYAAGRGSERATKGRRVIVLPVVCTDPVPDLPPGRDWSSAEREMWEMLWEGPQANEWDDSFVMAVAMYVAHTFTVLKSNAAAWHAQEARHLGDRLGLTPQGMAALGWQLAPSTPAPVVPLRGA